MSASPSVRNIPIYLGGNIRRMTFRAWTFGHLHNFRRRHDPQKKTMTLSSVLIPSCRRAVIERGRTVRKDGSCGEGRAPLQHRVYHGQHLSRCRHERFLHPHLFRLPLEIGGYRRIAEAYMAQGDTLHDGAHHRITVPGHLAVMLLSSRVSNPRCHAEIGAQLLSDLQIVLHQ